MWIGGGGEAGGARSSLAVCGVAWLLEKLRQVHFRFCLIGLDGAPAVAVNRPPQVILMCSLWVSVH